MNLRNMIVQKEPCKTCPFEGSEPIELTPQRYQELIENLMGDGQHFCHSTDNQTICRGGRNIQLRWLCAIGALSEPTDKAFNEILNQIFDDIEYDNSKKTS